MPPRFANQLLSKLDGRRRTELHQMDEAIRIVGASVTFDKTAEDWVARPGPRMLRYGSEGWGFESLRARSRSCW
jgi:hypothetical protein